MKDLIKTAKWLGGELQPFIIKLIIIVMTGSAISLLSVSIAVVSKGLIDAASEHKAVQMLYTAITFAGIILVQTFLDSVNTLMTARTSEAMSNNIRKRLFNRLSHTSWTDFSGYHSEDILTRMTSDTSAVANGIVNVMPGIISLGVRLGAAFVTLMLYEPALALLAFVLGPVTILLSRFYAKRLKYMHIKIQEAESTYRSFIHEAIQNMLIVKTFCIESISGLKIDRLQDERQNWVNKRSRFSAISNSALSAGYWAGYFMAFIFGAVRLSAGAVTFGTLTAFLQLTGQVQGPFIGLVRTLPQIISATASAGRLMEFEKLNMEYKNNETGTPVWTNAGVCFENVSFHYEEDKPVLKGASFNIRPGEIVALMGPSGEGKTTVVKLLLSLVYPREGNAFYTDGLGGRTGIDENCRKLVSYVPQGNTLFSGTIKENLLYGDPEADDTMLETAVRWAGATDFIRKLPDGFETRIGENGLGLSEGQSQRLGIARAFLRKTPVLILDEATSALDANTEMNVLKSIKNMSPARTCIIITHRTSVLEICQRVLILEDGMIREHNRNFGNYPVDEAI